MKIPLGAKPYLYPMPTTLIGAMVDGRPNFETIAFCGIVEHQPARIAISSGRRHFTNRGIRETGVFSVNVPHAGMVEVTDYCGIHSGARVDKGALFSVFYGQTGAPMIEECPLCMECRVFQTWEWEIHDVFIGEILEVYINDDALTDGKPDMAKIDPILYAHFQNAYYRVGEYLAPAFRIGLSYRPPAEPAGDE